MRAKVAKSLRRVALSLAPNGSGYEDRHVKTVPHVELQLRPDGTSTPVVKWIEKRTRRCTGARELYLLMKRTYGRLRSA